MKHIIFFTTLILLGCSTKKETTEGQAAVDTAVNDRSMEAEPKTESHKVELILDSLLRFDSEAAVKYRYGDQARRSTGYYPEGMGEYQNTLLFPETKNQVEFVWKDDSVTFSRLDYIVIYGHETDWKTNEGITLGTKLDELVKLNGKEFSFSGFGWDYGGGVNWENGRLHDRNIFVSLDYPGDAMPPEFEGLLGDQIIQSNSELARKANPIVVEIMMRR